MFSESIDDFFKTAEHATAGTYKPSGGSASTVNGIFEKEYLGSEFGNVGIENSNPTFLCKTADVSNAAHGDTIVLSGTTYNIRGVQPDGTGITLLELEEQ